MTALCAYGWSAGADRAGQSTRRGRRVGRENAARPGKRDRFEIYSGSQRERRGAVPETARGGLVVSRFRGF